MFMAAIRRLREKWRWHRDRKRRLSAARYTNSDNGDIPYGGARYLKR